MKQKQKENSKEPIFEEQESQRECSLSSDLFIPDSDDTQNTGKNPLKTKKINKDKKKGPSRNIGKGERKDKNTFPNIKNKIYRVSLKELGFASIILAGRLGSDVALGFENKEQTINVSLPKKCAKNQLVKFLILIAMNLGEAERNKARQTFVETVEKSIQRQHNKIKKRQEYREACEQSIATLQLIRQLINYFLRSADVTLDHELKDRLYCKESKKQRYNNGIKSIQKSKQQLLIEELQRIKLETNFNNEDYADVLDLSEHRYDRCSFEE